MNTFNVLVRHILRSVSKTKKRKDVDRRGCNATGRLEPDSQWERTYVPPRLDILLGIIPILCLRPSLTLFHSLCPPLTIRVRGVLVLLLPFFTFLLVSLRCLLRLVDLLGCPSIVHAERLERVLTLWHGIHA